MGYARSTKSYYTYARYEQDPDLKSVQVSIVVLHIASYNFIYLNLSDSSQAEPPPSLAYKIIAHDSKVQEEMDRQHLPWGVQYEIARGVSDRRWKWEDVTRNKISTLRTDTNVRAAQVPAVILGKPLVTAPAQVNEQRMWWVLFKTHTNG